MGYYTGITILFFDDKIEDHIDDINECLKKTSSYEEGFHKVGYSSAYVDARKVTMDLFKEELDRLHKCYRLSYFGEDPDDHGIMKSY